MRILAARPHRAAMSGGVARLNYLDTARAALMLLGIPYHAAQFYTHRRWYVTSNAAGGVLEYAGNYLHLFRMHAFYVVAGFFAAMLLERRTPGTWLLDRSRRLLIPLVFATLVILPLQEGVARAISGGDPLRPLHELARGVLPPSAQTWFLRDLFGYSCVVAVAYACLRPSRSSGAVRGVAVLALSALFVVASAAVVATLFLVLNAASLDRLMTTGVQRFVFYFPFFAAGVLLWLFPDAHRRLIGGRHGAVSGIAAVLALALLALLPRDTVATFPHAAAAYAAGAIGTWVTLNLCLRYLDRSSRIVDFFVEGALTIYLTHMILIVLAGGMLVDRLGWPVVEWLLIVALTLAGSTLVFVLVRRVPLLYFLLNGQFRRDGLASGVARSGVSLRATG